MDDCWSLFLPRQPDDVPMRAACLSQPVDVDVGILPLDSEDFWKCDDVCADEEVTVDGDVAEQELGGENAAPEARPEAPEGVRTCSEHAQSRSSGSDHGARIRERASPPRLPGAGALGDASLLTLPSSDDMQLRGS